MEIADTGSGMSEEVVGHAFEAVFTTTEVGTGIGLGPDIARRVVEERHGGTIRIGTGPAGSTLRVTLPARPRSEERLGIARTEPSFQPLQLNSQLEWE